MSLSPREEAMMDAIGKCMIEEIERAVAPLRERIAELEKGGIRYMGTHQRAQEYKRGSMVTHDGSLWCAVTDVNPNQVPGNGDEIGSEVTAAATLADNGTGHDRRSDARAARLLHQRVSDQASE